MGLWMSQIYTSKFLKILSTSFEMSEAFQLDIIDENGKRNKNVKLDSKERNKVYTKFYRLVFNVKKLIIKVPDGTSKLTSYASLLFLAKKDYGLTDKNIEKILKVCKVDSKDFVLENTEWFIKEDKMISPGVYRLRTEKILNDTYEEVVSRNDKIRFEIDSYPVGDMFGLDIYEATHMKTNKKLMVTIGELLR